MFRRSPAKKYSMLYNAIIRTGLSATPEMPPLDSIGTNAIIPPFFTEMPSMTQDQLQSSIVGYIGVFLHNALFCADFPTNKYFINLVQKSEKKLNKISHNPWLELMYSNGVKGICPDLESIANNAEPVYKMKLSISRKEWDAVVPKVVFSLVDWFVKNRQLIQDWQTQSVTSYHHYRHLAVQQQAT